MVGCRSAWDTPCALPTPSACSPTGATLSDIDHAVRPVDSDESDAPVGVFSPSRGVEGMSRMRRTFAVLVTVLLVAGAFASPVLAQTAVEDNEPYGETLPEEPEEPEEPESPEEPEEPQEPGEPAEPEGPGTEVGGVVDEADDVMSQPETEEQDSTTVMGVTLQRTGANSLLIAAIGLLALGIGGFLVARARRSASEV